MSSPPHIETDPWERVDQSMRAVFTAGLAFDPPPPGEETPVLSIRVWAAIWPTGDAFEMAGGIYPLEDLSAVSERTGTDEPGVTVEARPGGDRREVFDRLCEAAQ